jgi:hypothetical protein
MTDKDTYTDEAYIAAARETYCSDDLEIDDTPALSRAEKGSWVAAWVWVSNDYVAQ